MDIKGPGSYIPPIGTHDTRQQVPKTETALDTPLQGQASVDKAAQQVLLAHQTTTQTTASNKLLQFQQRLLTDHTARADFAANPKQFLDALGVKLPGNIQAPASIPLETIEKQVKAVHDALHAQNIDPNDLHSLTRFLEGTKAGQLPQAGQGGRQGIQNSGDTIVLTAVVLPGPPVVGPAVVVGVGVEGQQPSNVAAQSADSSAMPVVVYPTILGSKGVEQDVVNATRGVEGISAEGSTFTLHGPAGVRVEGLTPGAIAEIIKGLR